MGAPVILSVVVITILNLAEQLIPPPPNGGHSRAVLRIVNGAAKESLMFVVVTYGAKEWPGHRCRCCHHHSYLLVVPHPLCWGF